MTWPRAARAALVATVLVLLLTALAQIASAPPAYDVGGRLLNALMAVLYTTPLLVAHRRPLPAVLVVLGAVTADGLLGGQGGQQWFAILLAVFALGAHATTGASAVGLAVVSALVLSVDIPRLQQGDPVDEVVQLACDASSFVRDGGPGRLVPVALE